MLKIAVIGAGFSGLTVASLLRGHASVKLFEKARGVSGRMSTRRAHPYAFDHGAQYFTAKTKPFQCFIQPLLEQGLIEPWRAHCVHFDRNGCSVKSWTDHAPRYVGVPGMNQIAKFLAKDLDIQLNTRIISLDCDQKWTLSDEHGQQYPDFDWVVCALPSEQTLDLLPQNFNPYKHIEALKMTPCYALMLGFKSPLTLGFDAAYVSHSDVSWVAVNSHKPGRVGGASLLVHSSFDYAQRHISDAPNAVMQHLMAETSHITGCDMNHPDQQALHLWRYAQNLKKEPTQHIFLDPQQRLAACGDWCFGGRVEGAFNSAYNLVQKMKESVL